MSFLLASVLSVTHTHLLPKWLLWLIDDVVFYHLFKISHLYAKFLLWLAYKVPNVPPDWPDMKKRIKFTEFIVYTIPGPVRIHNFYLRCCQRHHEFLFYILNVWRIRLRRNFYIKKMKPYIDWYKTIVFESDPLTRKILNNDDIFYEWLLKINLRHYSNHIKKPRFFTLIKIYNTWVHENKPFNTRRKAVEFSYWTFWKRYLRSFYFNHVEVNNCLQGSDRNYGFLFNNNRLHSLRFFIYLSYVKKYEGFEFSYTEDRLKITIDASIMEEFDISEESIEQIEKDFNWGTLKNFK